ncbi:MAG: hypothetical protein E6J91_36570, partial [Deltaproteobacteria bacterium]
MTSRQNLVLSVVVGGLAVHGAITACGSIKSPVTDANASDGLAQVTDGSASNDGGIPQGTIVAFGGATAPSGWMLCDGSVVSRTIYANLFAAIGNKFGGGDGVSTFNLPDLRGRFVRGVDGGAGRDPDAANRVPSTAGGSSGDAVGSLQGDATAVPANPFSTESSGNHTHTNGAFD